MRILAVLLFLGLTTACNGVIKDFVDGAKPASPIPLPSTDTPATGTLKLSPGHMKATDNGIGIEANITTTKKVVSGGGLSAELSVGRTRSQ